MIEKINKNPEDTRICIFSTRNVLKEFYRSANYELEDVIINSDNADLLIPISKGSPNHTQRFFDLFYRRYFPNKYKYRIPVTQISRKYNVFVFICEILHDLPALNAIKNCISQADISICYIVELWAKDIPRHKRFFKLLAQFDYVFLNCKNSVSALQETIGKPCYYILPGVDTLRFSPYPNTPNQNIYIYSLGRKSLPLHNSLLTITNNHQLFYFYDTYDTTFPWYVTDYLQHRTLTANVIKRSRYFVVNPAKMDRTIETLGQTEIGHRFFEGAAGGSVMIGQPVESETFWKNFDWPDAVIPLSTTDINVENELFELDAQPQRLEKIRKKNVVNCLLRHDWVYRWEEILNKVGLEPTPALYERKNKLNELAQSIKQDQLDKDIY